MFYIPENAFAKLPEVSNFEASYIDWNALKASWSNNNPDPTNCADL